jgi:hypothetical protein
MKIVTSSKHKISTITFCMISQAKLLRNVQWISGRVPHGTGAAARQRAAAEPVHRQVRQARAVHHGGQLQQGERRRNRQKIDFEFMFLETRILRS